MSYHEMNVETSEISYECDASVSNDASKSDEIEEASSDNSAMDSSVWTKVHYLISTLKDVQLNLKEMGILMADNNKQPVLTRHLEQNSEAKSSLTPLDICIESPKTDEAKLNEILGLLHHIANTLSTYEQNPLLLGTHSSENDNENVEDGAENKDVKPSFNLEFDRKDYYCIAKSTNDNPLNSSLQSDHGEHLIHNLSAAYTQTEYLPDQKSLNLSNVGQDATKCSNQSSHMFSTQTKSLRKEIDDIILRKDALDDRLQLLFRQREHPAKSKQINPSGDVHGLSTNNEVHFGEQPFITTNPTNKCLTSKESRKHRHKDKSVRKRGLDKSQESIMKSPLLHDLCPSNPLVNNGDKIEELRQEEELFLGSADDGLSSEINSLNFTIQELVKENQHFYSFFQGIAAQNSLQADNTVTKAVGHSEFSNPTTTNETFKGEDFLIERNAQLEAVNTNIDESCSGMTNLQSSDVDLKKEESTFERTDSNSHKRQEFSADENGCTSPSDHRHIIHQLAYEKKINEERSTALENKIDSAIEQSSHQFSECANEFEKMNSESHKFADQIDNLFVQNEELRINIKNLGIHSNMPLTPQNSDTGTLQYRGEENLAVDTVEPHKTCLNHIEKLVSQNQSLHRQLFLVKSQFNSGSRKNSFPGALKPTDRSLMHQCLLDGTIVSCSTPASDLDPDSDLSKDLLKLSEGDNSCLEEELEILKSKVDYLENFMKNEANATIIVDSSTESIDNKKYRESQISLSILPQREIDDNDPVSENSCESWSRQQQQQLTPAEKSLFHKKIRLLLEEKQSLTNRLEELMVISQELAYHFKNTKEELTAVASERDALRNSINGNSQGGAIQLGKGLEEARVEQQKRTRELENELEKAWRLVHEKTLSRDKFAADKDFLRQTSDIAIAKAKEENASLFACNATLTKDCSSLSRDLAELKVLCNNKDEEIRQLRCQFKAKGTGVRKASIISSDDTTSGDGFTVVDLSEESIKKAGVEWQHSLDWLQKCLAEEKLHGRLLEAAEHESTTRVAVLQQALKETGNMYHELQSKYQKLRKVLHVKKSEKNKHRQVLKDCRGRVEELQSTTSALEDTYKVMLSTLGQNIGIAVDLLSSHLYLSPGTIHPSPELSVDPTFWFAAQCSRLRWLQAHLKKLGLHAWKGARGPSPNPQKEFPKQTTFVPEFEPIRKTKPSVAFKSKSFDLPPSAQQDETPTKQLSAPPSFANKSLAKPEAVVMEEDLFHIGSKFLESNIWATLNDAEISLTSQQIRLFQNKSKQIDSLVAILNRETNVPRGELSQTSSTPKSRLSENDISDMANTEIAAQSEESSTLKSSYRSELENENIPSTLTLSQSENDTTLKSSFESELLTTNESNHDSISQDKEAVCT